MTQHDSLGPRLGRYTRDGQRVSFVVDGVIEKYDAEKGYYTIRGNSRGAQHIDWKIKAHWATELHEWDGRKHDGETPASRANRTVIAEALALAERVILVHEQVVMDTPEDRALHDEACAAFRSLLAALRDREAAER